MRITHTLRRGMTSLTWVQIAGLIVASILPVVQLTSQVGAANVTSRSITMGNTSISTSTTYQIQFTVPNNGTENIGAFAVEFCDNDPLPGTSCTFTSGTNIPSLNSATLSGSPTFNGSAVSLSAISAGDRAARFTLAAAQDIPSDTVFNVTLNSVVNPSNAPNNTFFARLYTFAANTAPTINNPVTGYNNDGGVALSTAEQITLSARVQERLTFCVGTANPAANCGGVSGNSVDLGVLDTSATRTGIAYAQVSTNASNGVVIQYLADEFKVAGTVCGTTAISPGPASATDRCLNRDNAANGITNGTEEWGMRAAQVADGSTSNVTVATNYSGTNYSFVANTATTIASSTASSVKVADSEQLTLTYGATTSATTPTGVYGTIVSYIATGTF